MRLIDADALKEKFKEHYDFFVSAYKNEQDMSLSDKSRVDEILNSMAEVINAPTVFDTDNATNGDVMKTIFPNMRIEKHCSFARFVYGEEYIPCSYSWLNAPYKGDK